ncbi:MAG TPA: YceD family protein [Gammaproteobacteria bacterium]|nr:YceD family protein [Gammaproteobacteria bacterium]
MSDRTIINSPEFAQAGTVLRGTLAVSEMKRLRDVLYDDAGTLEFCVQGECDARGRPRLRLAVNGVMHLRCQRCLESIAHAVDIATELRLASEAELGREIDPEEPGDIIPADVALDVGTLLEDEVLLSLPLAPHHAAGACDARPASGEGSKPGPFSALARLKKD